MDNTYEKLRKELWMNGMDAIEDFLGYEVNPEEDSDVTDYRIEEAYQQMPKEEISQYLEKYHISAED